MCVSDTNAAKGGLRNARTLAMPDTGRSLTTKIQPKPGHTVCCPGRLYQREIMSTVTFVMLKDTVADREEGKRGLTLADES